MNRSIKRHFLTAFLLASTLAFSSSFCATDTPRTPDPGSAERQAICDAARPFVIKEYAGGSKLPQPIVFQVSRMKVLGDYCSFEAIPRFKDGSGVSTEYMMDIAFALCLEKSHGQWHVIYDLSSTDVPSDAQMKEMWKTFPKEFPFSLIPEFWREKFDRARKAVDPLPTPRSKGSSSGR